MVTGGKWIRSHSVLALFIGVLALTLLAPIAANAQVTVKHVRVTVGPAPTFSGQTAIYCDTGIALGPGSCDLQVWNLGAGQLVQGGETMVLTQTGRIGGTGFQNFDTSDRVVGTTIAGCNNPNSPCMVTIELDTGSGLVVVYSDSTGNELDNFNMDTGGFHQEQAPWSANPVHVAANFTLKLGYADTEHGCTSDCLPNPFDGSAGTTKATYFLGHAIDAEGLCTSNCYDGGALLITGKTVTNGTCPVTSTQLGQAGGFALLALNNGTMIINSATSIVGDVGYSKFVTSHTNQKVDSFIGTAYVHSTANVIFTLATFKPSGGIVTGGPADTLLDQANASIQSASSFFAGLASNGSLGNVTTNLSLNAAGPITVFDATSWTYNSDTLTLNGNPSSVFVIRISGNLAWAQSNTVLNGVQAANIVFYFPNSSSITVNKASTVFAGRILAPNGSVIYHNPATFNGAIIAKDIDVHSDFNIAVPICVQQ